MLVPAALWFLAAAGAGCATEDSPSPDLEAVAEAADDGVAADPRWRDAFACPSIFRQDLLPTYHVTIAPSELAALEHDFRSPYVTYQQTGSWPDELPKIYRPLTAFQYENIVITDAQIRLKGNSSWRHAIEHDGDLAKMQFVISFNEVNRKGRFHGVRKLELDMPRNDPSMLRQRIGLEYMRTDLVVPAQCANNARLYINGTYYGLFTAMERLDKEFLQRNFTARGDDDGDLWDGGNELETNEETSTRARRDQLFAATTMTQVTALVDMDATIREWAGEAMMPAGDGYYGSGHNYFLYDHPTRGFFWLVHDLDAAISYRPPTWNPLFWSRSDQPAHHYMMVMNDPAWREAYVAALCGPAYEAYDVPALQARIGAYAAQIESAAAADPRFRFSPSEWQAAVTKMQTVVAQRKQFIHDWCGCYANGGADADGDGTRWCLDVADADPAVALGAPETCGPDPVALEPLDDNCNGLVDEGCEPAESSL